MRRILILLAICFYSILCFSQIHDTVSIHDVEIKDMGEYVQIGNEHILVSDSVGNPSVPAVEVCYAVPLDAENVTIETSIINSDTLVITKPIYPVQPPRAHIEDSIPFVNPNPDIYASSALYPNVDFRIKSDERIMGYRVIRVAYYPIIYNPQSQMIYNRNLNVNIGYTSANGVYFNAPKASENRKRIATQFIKGLVKNKHDIERQTSSNSRARNITNNKDLLYGEKVPDYIIITSEELKPIFQRLANWKTQKGVPTIIRTIESIDAEYSGGDLVDKIKNYLDDFASKWGDEGLYVLLGGDSEIVPTREVESDSQREKLYELMATDAFLVDKGIEIDWTTKKIEKTTSQRNIFLGRIPVKTPNEARTFIDKLLLYEKMPNSFNCEYIKNILISAAFMEPQNKDGHMEYYQNHLLTNIPQNINYWYLFDHFNCSLNDHQNQDYNTDYGAELNKNSFISALNGEFNIGYPHLIFHEDHGQTMRFGLSEVGKTEGLDNLDIYRLNMHNESNIIVSLSCHPANFIGDCIAENFLKKNTIAFLGFTDVGWRAEYDIFKRLFEKLYSNQPPYLFCLNSLGSVHASILSINSSYNKHRFHLLGDPEMSVWTDVPSDLNVTITPDSINAGENTVSVQLHNLPSTHQANICVMKDTEVYFTSTIDDTNVHEYTFTPKTSGNLMVTITAHNFRPYVKTIPVSANEGHSVMISEIEDFDGMVYSGQQVELDVKLKNVGNTVLEQVTAELTTSSPYITITNNQVNYGNMLPNTEVPSSSPFVFNVSMLAPSVSREDFNATCFYLTMKDSCQNVVGIDTFKIDISCVKYRILGVHVRRTSDGDLIPEANEEIVMYTNIRKDNEGSGAPLIDIEKLGNTSNYIDTLIISNLYWRFKLSETYNGENLLFFVSLISNNQVQDTLSVTITKTPPAVNSTNFSWQPQLDGIMLYCSDEYKIHDIYRSESINGTYVKLNDSPLRTSMYYDLDATSDRLYYYKITPEKYNLTGVQSSPITAWKSYATEMFTPRYLGTSMSAYIHPPTTYDVDYDGTKDLVFMARYDNSKEGRAVVLNDDGTEPYDIDNDGDRFLNGFAKLPWSSCEATPVVADIYNNGEPCLISVTRNNSNKAENYIVCVSSMDKNNDGVPDTLWTKQLSNPYYRSAIATDIDYPDGENKKEIILLSTDGGTIKILDCNGNLKYNLSSLSNGTYNMPAVADLNNDGYKEIVCTDANGVYIWQYDSCSYNKTCIFSSPSSIKLSSSPVICDLNKNGVKDIIVASNRASRSYIYAIDANSNLLDGFPVSISYSGATGAGLDHQVTVGDINSDGYPEIVALGTDSVKAWNKSGELIFGRRFKGLLPNTNYSVNMTEPLLADVDGDSIPDIIFYLDEKVYVLDNEGNDVEGFPIITKKERLTGLSISDIDNDGKNEIIAGDMGGYIHAWKTDGISTAIEWGRSRFDTGFTGEYVSGYQDPLVITESTDWQGGPFVNDIIVRSGTLRIPSGKTLQMPDACRLYVLDGGTLEVDGGVIANADILIKDGGTLKLVNNGTIHLNRFGEVDTELGAQVEMQNGEILLGNE